MEWLTCIKSSINYIEEHIKENLSIEDIARTSYISSYYLQVGFQIMTGYSIGEYIRNRKLYLAEEELKNGKKVIDVAFDSVYAPFGNIPSSMIISPEVLGITDALSVQIKQAAYKVGKGELTIDEAIALYGTYKD